MKSRTLWRKKYRRRLLSELPRGKVLRLCGGCAAAGWFKSHEWLCAKCLKSGTPVRYRGRHYNFACQNLRKLVKDLIRRGRHPKYTLAQGPCEMCGEILDVRRENSRTMYSRKPRTAWDALLGREPEDPNRDVALCRDCAEVHHEHWNDMWSDYYNMCY